MAYIDHTAEEAVIQHVQRCPACTRQAEELATFQAILTAKLHRVSCPRPDQLIAYHQRELQGSEKLIVAQHLRQCPHCARQRGAPSLAVYPRKGKGLVRGEESGQLLDFGVLRVRFFSSRPTQK